MQRDHCPLAMNWATCQMPGGDTRGPEGMGVSAGLLTSQQETKGSGPRPAICKLFHGPEEPPEWAGGRQESGLGSKVSARTGGGGEPC